jgi:hypothetical protein
MRFPLSLVSPLLGSVLAACAAQPATESAPPEPFLDELTEPALAPRYTEEGEEVLLEERSDGARLLGRMLGAVIDTDEEPVWVIRTEAAAGQPLDPSLEGARVRDATFLANGVVTIGEDHVLRSHVNGEANELDADALGPLSVAGTVVAYVRGTMPFYELASADVATGTARDLTADMAPVWSPAVGPDGRSIVFVSGVTGVPRIYLMRDGGAPEMLPESAAFPSSLGAPRFDGTTLVFEDEAGQTHTLAVAPLPRIEGAPGALSGATP